MIHMHATHAFGNGHVLEGRWSILIVEGIVGETERQDRQRDGGGTEQTCVVAILIKSSSRAHPPTAESGSTSSTRTTYFAIFLPSLRTRRCSYFIIPVASLQQGAYNFGRSRWLYSFFCDPGLSATRSWWHLSAMLRDTVAPAFLPRSAAHMM